MKVGKAKVDLFEIQSIEIENKQMKYPRSFSQEQDIRTTGKLV